jgi:septum formation protein
MSLWRGSPLVLASKSAVRRTLLEAAGIAVTVDPAELDERTIEMEIADKGAGPDAVAARLARDKALAVAARHRGALVLGADQTLALGARRFSKPATAAAARAQIASLSGKTHVLHSAATLAYDGAVVFETAATAHLTMRSLSEAAIDAYLAAAGDRVCQSVGAYQLEGLGIHLFERIDGDHFTILGLPLLPLLAFFREQGRVP